MHPLSLFGSTNLVLLFHTVPSSDWFRNTLKTIKHIYRFISVEDIESYYYNSRSFNNCCHICFDDGTRSVCEHAFPVLQEMNIPATLFVSPKVISEESNYWFQELSYLRNHLSDNVVKEMICETLEVDYEQIKTYRVLYLFKCMKLKDIFQVISAIKEKYGITIDKKFNLTKDQLLELNNSNLITIGAHTMNHPILYNETDDDSEKEIQESIKKLFNMLNKDIKYFAYPNGSIGLDFGVREQLILQKNKIKLAFSTNNDFFDKKTNPLNIPRFGFSGLKIENSAYIFGKLFIVPIWHNILDIRFLGKTERRERKEIKNFSIFKYP